MKQKYTPVFENAVYSKDKSVTIGDEQVLLKDLVLVKRYTEASEEQVIEYLKKKAAEVEPAASLELPRGIERPNKSPLESTIMELPDKIIRDLKTGDENCITFIRQNTEAPVVKDGEPQNQYLHVRYGLVPARVIETNQEAGNIGEADWYDAAFSDEALGNIGLGEKWNMQLLLEKGVLPDKDEMDILLKHGTHGSKTLEINKVRYSPDEVKEVMDFVYGRFSTPKKIEQLKDISDDFLEKLALQPVIGFHKMVQQNEAAQELMKKLQGE